jgi:hypothetical protein
MITYCVCFTRPSTIREVSRESSESYFFTLGDGKVKTIKQYQEEKLGRPVRNAFLPVVQITKDAWYPLSMCTAAPGWNFFGRLNSGQVTKMMTSKCGSFSFA